MAEALLGFDIVAISAKGRESEPVRVEFNSVYPKPDITNIQQTIPDEIYANTPTEFTISGAVEPGTTFSIEELSSGVIVSKDTGIADGETLIITVTADNLDTSFSFKIIAVSAKGKRSDPISVEFAAVEPKPTSIEPLSQARRELAATTIGDYALFGGGRTSSASSVVDAYDMSLTHTTPTPLSQARNYLAATTIGDYALFSGGRQSSFHSDAVDAYDRGLTRTTPTPLSQARSYLPAAMIGNYALFGGGTKAPSAVDAYDRGLTRTIPTPLSQVYTNSAATAVGDYALFGGGHPSSAAVDAYDTSLTRTTQTPLSQGRGYLASTTIGNYALFGGGASSSKPSDPVDVYDKNLNHFSSSDPAAS